MEKKKKFRNGNGVLEITREATGRAADQLRDVMAWNSAREKDARAKGHRRDAERFAANRAGCAMELIRIAQRQAA